MENAVVSRYLQVRSNKLTVSEVEDICSGLTTENTRTESIARRLQLSTIIKPDFSVISHCFLQVLSLQKPSKEDQQQFHYEKILSEFASDAQISKVIALKLLGCLKIAPFLKFGVNGVNKTQILNSIELLFANLTKYHDVSVIRDLVDITIESEDFGVTENSDLKQQFLIFQRASEIFSIVKSYLTPDSHRSMLNKFEVKTDRLTMFTKCDFINTEWSRNSDSKNQSLTTTDKQAIFRCLSRMNQILVNSGAHNFCEFLKLDEWSSRERWCILSSISSSEFSLFENSNKMKFNDLEYRQITIEILNSQKFDMQSELKKLCFLSQSTVEKIISTPAFIKHFHMILPEITDFGAFSTKYLLHLSKAQLNDQKMLISELLHYFPDFEYYLKDMPEDLVPVFIELNKSKLSLKFMKHLVLILVYQASFCWLSTNWKRLDIISVAINTLKHKLKFERNISVNTNESENGENVKSEPQISRYYLKTIGELTSFMLENGIDWKLLNFLKINEKYILPSCLHEYALHQFSTLNVQYSSKIEGSSTSLLEAFLFCGDFDKSHLMKEKLENDVVGEVFRGLREC